MTDKEFRSIVHSEFDNITAESSFKAKVLKGLQGDDVMDNKNKIAENKEITVSGAKVNRKGRYYAAVAALVFIIGGGAFLLGQSNNEIESSPSQSSQEQSPAVVYSERANEFISTRVAMNSKFPFADYYYLEGDKYLVNNSGDFYIYDAVTEEQTIVVGSAEDDTLCNVAMSESGFVLYKSLTDVMESIDADINYYDFGGNLVSNFRFSLDDVTTDNRNRTIQRFAPSADGNLMFVLVTAGNADGTGSSEIYSVTADGTIQTVDDGGYDIIDVDTYDAMLYVSEDGKAVYSVGKGFYNVYTDEYASTTYSEDFNVRESVIDENIASEEVYGFTNSQSIDGGKEIYPMSAMANNKLYVMNSTSPKGSTFETKDGDLSNLIKTDFEFTDVSGDYGCDYSGYCVSENGKYIITNGAKYDENGSLQSSCIAVYDGETMSAKPIWSTEVNGVVNYNQLLVDEESGAIVIMNCDQDTGSAYTAVIGQDETDTQNDTVSKAEVTTTDETLKYVTGVEGLHVYGESYSENMELDGNTLKSTDGKFEILLDYSLDGNVFTYTPVFKNLSDEVLSIDPYFISIYPQTIDGGVNIAGGASDPVEVKAGEPFSGEKVELKLDETKCLVEFDFWAKFGDEEYCISLIYEQPQYKADNNSSDKTNSEYDSENAVTVIDGKITFMATNSPKNAEMTDANTFVTKDGILSVFIDCEIKDGKIYTTATFTNLTDKDISIDTSLAPGVVSEHGYNSITGAMAAPNTIEANGTYTTSFEEDVPEDDYNLIYKFGRSSSNNTDSLFYMDIINN